MHAQNSREVRFSQPRSSSTEKDHHLPERWLLVDGEDPSSQIAPLIEPPDECMRTTNNHHPATTLHTFPDPPSLQHHYLHEEVAYRPEDHSPVFSLSPFCEAPPHQPQYQPCSNLQFCPVWPSREMETQHDHAAPILVDPPSLQESYLTYTQSGNSYPLPALYFSHVVENPNCTLPVPSPQTPALAPLSPVLSPPTPALDSPFSLSSSSEIGMDTALNSPYPSSTMESEPELYYDESEFAQEYAPAHADYATHAHFYAAQYPAFCADIMQHAHGYPAGHISPAPVVPDAYSPIPFAQSVPPATDAQEWHGTARFTYENGYDEHYYADNNEAYSNLMWSTDGYQNYMVTEGRGEEYHTLSKSADENNSCAPSVKPARAPRAPRAPRADIDQVLGQLGALNPSLRSILAGEQKTILAGEEEKTISTDEQEYYTLNPTPERIPRADIHQVLEELNALKPSLRSIPERTQNYAAYHNTLAKLANESENAKASGKRTHREDLGKMIGVSHLTTPAKATAVNTLPPRTCAASTQPHASAMLHRVPAIDSDTMAKIINRKQKRSTEIEKSPLDTIIKGSKVLRLTHSYQQAIVKPEPIPKKRKTKKEVIEHIHKQIPEFSSLPQPVPKTTPKKPNKDFWKTLF